MDIVARSSGPKKIPEASVIGQQGINLIERRVLALGWAWNPSTLDAGIDGVIEIRDPATQEATNLILQVQSKATRNQWSRETESSFEFLCGDRDLDYWMRGNAPVLLVCSRPNTEEAYWISVKDHFASPERRKSRVARFDKATDKFDESTRDRLVHVAIPTGAGVYLSPAPRAESLLSNLVPVRRLPSTLWLAPTEFKDPRDFWGRLRELVDHPQAEWVLREGRVLTVHDLDTYPWREVCEVGGAEQFDASEWLECDDRDRIAQGIDLLRRCLREMLVPMHIEYDRRNRIYYFRSRADGKARQIPFKNRRRSSRRTVVNHYMQKDGKTVAYHRHAAFGGEFRRFDRQWFLEVNPTYHFTRDGREPYPWYEGKLSGIKKLERNEQVESQIRLIEWLLTAEDRERNDLFSSEPYLHLAFSKRVAFEVPVGVPDHDWLPGQGAELEDEDPLPLFDWSGV